MARFPTTSDVFNAIADVRRREILVALMAGEMAAGTIVADLSLSQPRVSEYLRVLTKVGPGEVPGAGASPAVQPGACTPPAVARLAGQVRADVE